MHQLRRYLRVLGSCQSTPYLANYATSGLGSSPEPGAKSCRPCLHSSFSNGTSCVYLVDNWRSYGSHIYSVVASNHLSDHQYLGDRSFTEHGWFTEDWVSPVAERHYF
jgi:hypothetical protein